MRIRLIREIYNGGPEVRGPDGEVCFARHTAYPPGTIVNATAEVAARMLAANEAEAVEGDA